MDQRNIPGLITSLIDGEINDADEKEIKALIEKDKDIEFDYKIQLLIKTVVQQKLIMHSAPEKIKSKTIGKINPSAGIFSIKPLAVLGILVLIILAVILII